ncbi:MAG: hypothetical protein E6H56_13560 [Betaproteobacteria bacterium]|nr:MAG: hypothetical protein E6H56_13560 [Betaproteobacteria bacterium]
MRLYKELLTPDNVVPPKAEFIMESKNRDELKRKAERLAAISNDLMWGFVGKIEDPDYEYLIVDEKYRFVIKGP